jgi:murein L,D-transpeptidase YafK
MRLTNRPEYAIRRFFHHTGVSFDVWRRNRSTASAFHDPLVDGERSASIRFRAAGFRRFALFVAMGLAAGLAFQSRAVWKSADFPSALFRSASGPMTESEDMPSLASVPASVRAPEIPAPVPDPAPAAFPATAPSAAADSAPLPVFRADGFVLVACKRDRTLYVYKRAGKHWEKTAAYPMAIGRKTGDKSHEGDQRTPEGRYWIHGLKPGPAEGPIYGPLAFTLNYPHPGDEAEGKSGQGIWIHGVEAGKLPTYTRGCLSLANEDVLALAAYADIGTPVIILPDSLSPDPDRQIDVKGMEREFPEIVSAYGRKTRADMLAREKALKQAREYVADEARRFPELAMQVLTPEEKQEILDKLRQWSEDWSSRDMEKYARHYDPDFRDREGRDRQAFLERKRRIFESKTNIRMEMDDPRLEPEGYSRVKASFRQDYLAEGPQGPQRSSGSKSIRLEAGPDGWLIITE